MAEQTLTCPECGKIGNVSTQAVAPGVAVFDIMLGLDPFGCAGCRETLTNHRYVVVNIKPVGGGVAVVEPKS